MNTYVVILIALGIPILLTAFIFYVGSKLDKKYDDLLEECLREIDHE